MSGNSKDILETEKMAHIESVLSAFRPHVEIDRRYQRELRLSLLSEKKSLVIDWYRLFSRASILATSFLAVFALWKVYVPSHEMTERMDREKITLSKSSDAPSGTSIPMGTSMTAGLTPSGEIAKSTSPDGVENEIASIEKDLFDFSDSLASTPRTDTLPTTSRIQKTKEPEANIEKSEPPKDLDSLLMIIATPEVPNTPVLTSTESLTTEVIESGDTTMITSDATYSDTPTTTTQTGEATFAPVEKKSTLIIPQYNQLSLIYIKYGKWTPRERISRSGTGVVAMPIPARSRYAVELDSQARVGDTPVRSINIIYISATRSGDTTRSYLIPAIRYILSTGEVRHVALVDGYSY